MPLYMPISIKGEGVNLSVLTPFVLEPPAVNLGQWLTTIEYLQFKYPDVIITTQNELGHFAYQSSLERAYRIPEEYMAAFQSSKVQITVIGDVEEGYRLWNETTSIPGMFRIVSQIIRPKAGVVNPKIRLIVHNNTKAFLASEWIDLVPLEPAHITSMTDEVYDRSHPLLIDTENQSILFKVRTNADVLALRRFNDRGENSYSDGSPYPITLKSLNVAGREYQYVYEIKYTEMMNYGTETLIGVEIPNRIHPEGIFAVVTLLRSQGNTLEFVPISSYVTVEYITRGGIKYDVTGTSADVEIPAATTLTKISDEEYDVAVQIHALNYYHPSVVNLPISESEMVASSAKAQKDSIIKDMVIATYDYLDENGDITATHELTWRGLYNIHSKNTALLPIPLNKLPHKLVFRYDMNGTGEATLTFNMKPKMLTITRSNNVIGYTYYVKSLLIREPLNLVITPKDPDSPVNELIIFKPGFTVPITRENSFTTELQETQRPIQEILDDIRN